MSDFSVPPLQFTDQRSNTRPSPSTFDRILQGAGLPAEVIARAVGGILTDNPRYNFDNEFLGDPVQQPQFSNVLEDLGAPPAVAIPVGLVGEILNPLDPLNKITGGATKLGAATKLAASANRVGEVVQATVKGRNIKLINTTRLEKLAREYDTILSKINPKQGQVDIANLLQDSDDVVRRAIFRGDVDTIKFIKDEQGNLENLLKGASTQEQAFASATRTRRGIEDALRERRDANEILQQFQLETGNSFDDLIDLPTRLEDLRIGKQKLLKGQESGVRGLDSLEDYRGLERSLVKEEYLQKQRAVFGLTDFDPRKTNFLFNNTTGVGRAASTVPGLAVTGSAGAAISGLSNLGQDILTGIKSNVFDPLLTKMGYSVLRTDTQKHLYNSLRQVLRTKNLDSQQLISEVENIRTTYPDLEGAGFRQIVDALEDGTESSRASLAVLREQLLDTPIDQIRKRAAKKIQRATEEQATGILDENRRLMVSPSRVSAQDGKQAVERAGLSLTEQQPLRNETGLIQDADRFYVDDDYIVITLNKNSDLGSKSPDEVKKLVEGNRRLQKVGVLPKYRVETNAAGETLLVAKKAPGAQLVSEGLIDTAHIDNLQKGAAQLSSRGYTLNQLNVGQLDASGIPVLVSPNGAVQLLDTGVFTQKASKGGVKQVSIARDFIRRFAEETNYSAAASVELPALRSPRQARSVREDSLYYTFVDSRSTALLREAGEEVIQVPAYELLNLSENGSGIADIVRGVNVEGYSASQAALAFGHNNLLQRANNIENIRNQFRASKLADPAADVAFDPISYIVGPNGGVIITDGLDRLGAAVLEGFQNVPMIRKPFIGEISQNAGGTFRPYAITAKETLENHPILPVMRRFKSKTANLKAQQFDDSYRILKEDGTPHMVREAIPRGLEGEPTLNHIVQNVTSSGSRSQQYQLQAAEDLKELLYRATGEDPATAALVLSRLVDESPDYVTFTTKLEGFLLDAGVTSNNFGRVLRGSQSDGAFRAARFNETRQVVNQYLDLLAEKGYFVNSANKIGRMTQYSEATGRAVVSFDEATNTLFFIDSSIPINRAALKFDDFFKGNIEYSSIVQGDRFALVGADDVKQGIFGDLVDGRHPRLDPTKPTASELSTIDPVLKAEWEKQGIYVNPKFTDKSAKFNYDPVLKTLKSDNQLVFYTNRSGDMVVGIVDPGQVATVDTIKDVIRRQYGDGADAIRIQEFGFMARDKIFVNNLDGIREIDTLTDKALLPLRARLRNVAERLESMGVSTKLQLEVSPFIREDVWNQIYRAGKRKVRIEDALSDSFKLTVPEEYAGLKFDLSLRTDEGIVGVRRPELDPTLQHIFDWAQENLDDIAREELLRGLPLRFMPDYFPRVMTVEAKNSLNTTFDNFVKNSKKREKFLAEHNHLKGRKLTDLSTNEVNQLFSNPDFSVEKLIDFADSSEQAAHLRTLHETTSGGLKMFHDDVTIAVAQRKLANIQSQATTELIDEIKSMGDAAVLWSGDVGELSKVIDDSKNLTELERAVNEAQEAYSRFRNSVDDIDGLVARSSEAKNEIAKLEERYNKSLRRYNQALRTSRKKLGLVQDGRTTNLEQAVWIRGSDARRLVDEGAFTERAVLDPLSNDLVRVETSQLTARGSSGVETFLMSPETEGVLNKLYDLRANRGGEGSRFMKFFDQFQGMWKKWTLFPIPGFHIRNSVSNATLAWLAGINDLDDYTNSFRVWRTMQSINPTTNPLRPLVGKSTTNATMGFEEGRQALASTRLFSSVGSETNLLELWENFVIHDGLHGGLALNEFNGQVAKLGRESSLMRLAAKQGTVPASELARGMLERIGDAPIVRGGAAISAMQENFFRFAAFTHQWRKTGNFDQAGMFMKKVFYDYNDLNAFEKTVLRRIVPFYSWVRFNTPRMIETLMTRPVHHMRIARLVNDIENGAMDSPGDRDKLPEWLSSRYGIIVGKQKDGKLNVVAGDYLLPMADLYTWVRGSERPLDLIYREASESLTPLLKIPVEQALNRSMFTGADIENAPGELAKSGTLSRLGQTRRATNEGPLGIINLLWNQSNFDNLFRLGSQLTQVADAALNFTNKRGEEAAFDMMLFTELTLARIYQIDPEKTATWMNLRYNKLRSSFTRLRDQAIEEGNPTAERYYNQRLTNLELIRNP